MYGIPVVRSLRAVAFPGHLYALMRGGISSSRKPMTSACLTTDRSAPDGRLAIYARSLEGAEYGGGESELARSPNLQSEI
jgi:hypothetical protein